MSWNVKESEEEREGTRMKVVNRGEWEKLRRKVREMKWEIKGWRKDMKKTGGCLEELRSWIREKTEVVKERKGKVWGEGRRGARKGREEESERRPGDKVGVDKGHAEREEKRMEGMEEVGGRWSDWRQKKTEGRKEKEDKSRAERWWKEGEGEEVKSGGRESRRRKTERWNGGA